MKKIIPRRQKTHSYRQACLPVKQAGFTLIELILVIAIIIIIAAAIFVALNPAKRLGDANDSRRWSDVNQTLSAIHQYIVDNKGAFPNSGSWTVGQNFVLGTDGSGCNTTCTAVTTQSACLNLTNLTTNNYIAAIPTDPVTGTAGNTDYYVSRNPGGIVTVGACDPYGNAPIKVMR
ncbi:MAG: prepilin-type N-terminal cleavage/methylation domain-containing protein [Patescibacteria group bacterium]|nr:prepilin-type N-terminal cleavage/methylation domain-containing protein [Patescibacteria group bacterium]